jgi:protein TonB
MKYFLVLLLTGILCSSAKLAVAQVTYCPIYPMPELPGGGGMPAIVAAIQQRLAYPPQALRAQASGRVFVSFTVVSSGQVQEVVVVKAFRRDCGLAVVRAVRQLPRFKPRLARYGNVRYVAPLRSALRAAGPLAHPRAKNMGRHTENWSFI